MDAATHCEKPLLRPYPFAGIMVRTVGLTIKVGGERRMVSKPHSIERDGFFGGGNDLIERKWKGVCIFIGVTLKRRSNETSNSSFNPVAEIVFPSQVKTMSRVEIKTKKFLASKINARQNIPHVRHMEDVDDLASLINLVWGPCT